jgi:FkbM family methyltransferase
MLGEERSKAPAFGAGNRPAHETGRILMRIQDSVLRAWQKCPQSWRSGLVKSRFASPLRRLMNSLYPGGTDIFPLAAPLKGNKMRLDVRSSKAFIFGTYEPQVIRGLLSTVRNGWTVVDIGAHVGYFALLLSKLVGPDGKVIAFEPVSENFRALEENVRLNDCRNVILEKRAVTSVSGPVTMRSNDTNQLTFTASLVHGQPIADVDAVSLDDYFAGIQEPVRFVMMDVEGAEEAVLQGMRAILRRDLPTILIELHGFEEYGEAHPALRELRSLDYHFRFLDLPGSQVHILAEPN